MEIVSVKFQEEILKKIDLVIENNNFNSRTEFIREAVRDKLSEIEKQELIKKFMSLRGKGKPRTNLTDREIREKVGKEFLEDFKRKYGN